MNGREQRVHSFLELKNYTITENTAHVIEKIMSSVA